MAFMQKKNHSIWAIVPAAGIGKRMQADMPKQYLQLNDRPVLEYTLNTLLQNDNIAGLVIALQPDDPYWPAIKIDSQKPVLRTTGGKERADSVLNALDELFSYEQFSAESDWVLVHDAVRCCLQQQDIDKLLKEVADNRQGGLLALPVRDTMKRQMEDSIPAAVAKTVERDNLWHALTPQYFPAYNLKVALETAQQKGLDITDESSAMELAGFSPILVHGQEDNIKITRPDDLRLAGLYLQAQQSQESKHHE
jgi:2-C-methyl-D-erythritol 4-phosphate cytidylyltransferase